MMPRLATDIWVSAYLNRLRLAGIPVYVIAKGDAKAGAVLIKLSMMDGTATLFEQRFDLGEDHYVWTQTARGIETEVDAVLTRARLRDTDVWIIEIEDRAGRTLLDEKGLAH
jgi:hypothetical protein